MFRRTLGSILFSAILAAPCAADGSVTVTALGRGKTPIPTSDKITVTKYPTLKVLTSIKKGDSVAPKELLTGSDDELKLELSCPSGDKLSFHGRFVVLIGQREDGGCAVDLREGKADVLSNRPTEITAAGKVMGSEGTRYVVIVERETNLAQLLVWKGVVQVGSAGAATRVPNSQSLDLGGGSETTKVTEEQIGRWAGNYARLDLIKAKRRLTKSQAARLEHCLTKTYAKVLRNPDDIRAQRALERLRARRLWVPRSYFFL